MRKPGMLGLEKAFASKTPKAEKEFCIFAFLEIEHNAYH